MRRGDGGLKFRKKIWCECLEEISFMRKRPIEFLLRILQIFVVVIANYTVKLLKKKRDNGRNSREWESINPCEKLSVIPWISFSKPSKTAKMKPF